jgi:RecB family exonuclease
MTTVIQINCHAFATYKECESFIKGKKEAALTLCVQPLFINDCPHIMPLQYFFDQQSFVSKYEVALSKILHQHLQATAPDTLSEKSIRCIGSDVLANVCASYADAHSYEWIHQAVYLTKESDAYKDYITYMQQVLSRTAHWINTHYKEIVIFGYNATAQGWLYKLIEACCDSPNIPVHWVVPGKITATHTYPLHAIQEWVMRWKESQSASAIQRNVWACTSVDEECRQALSLADASHKKGVQIACVIPNTGYKKTMQTVALQCNIPIQMQQKLVLLDTNLGKLVRYSLEWLKHGSIHTIQELLALPIVQPLDGVLDLRKKIQRALQNNRYYKDNAHRKGWLETALAELSLSPIIERVIHIKTVKDLQHILDEWSLEFSIDSSDYQDYVVIESLRKIIMDALESRASMEDLCYMVQHTSIPSENTNGIPCITPEEFGRYPSHYLMVLGVGQDSWGVDAGNDSYLNSDNLGIEDGKSELRNAFGWWLVNTDQVVSISYAQSINGLPQDPLSIIGGERNIVADKNGLQSTFYRKPIVDAFPLPVLDKVSPSELELYQTCPYAFFLKKIIGLQSKKAITDAQKFGILFHQVIEAIVNKNITKTDAVLPFLEAELPPLMARMYYIKLNSGDWDMDEMIMFIKSSLEARAEEVLQMQRHGVLIGGRADMIRAQGDGYEVIDFKTGTPPTQPAIESLQYIQIGLYALMAESTYGPTMASIVSKNNVYKPWITLDATKKSMQWETYKPMLEDHIDALLQNIKKGSYQAHDYTVSAARHAQQCRVCDYYHVCASAERHQR